MKTSTPVALITGAGKRVGKTIAITLHQAGYNVIIHYNRSKTAAQQLARGFNQQRANSASCVQGNLVSVREIKKFCQAAIKPWQRLDVLVNNASSFYPTPTIEATETHWEDLIGSNLKGPFFIIQQCLVPLTKSRGCIINMADIYGEQPLAKHAIYSAAKAGLIMLTKSLAKDLGPAIRVNAIAPGTILWPEHQSINKEKVLQRTALKKSGTPEDIARTILFLINSPYITGQVIRVDGGRF